MSSAFRQCLFQRLILCALLLVSSFLSLANAASASFTLKDATNLPISKNQHHWLSPVSIPSDSQKMLIAERQGKVFFFTEAEQQTLPLIDLSNDLAEQQFLSLTAVAAHPSFALKDQVGSGTVYTAHIEAFNAKLNEKRLYSAEKFHQQGVDVVINQWLVERANTPTVNSQSKREILRINLPSKDYYVSQLSFNPYLPSWDDNYGLLHIGLANDSKPQQNPLLSGAILRINPEPFGLKTYTTPIDNPFIRNQSIADEIIALGLGKLNKFLWQKNNIQQVIVHQQINKQQMLSAINIGDDKRNNKTLRTLWQTEQNQQLSLPLLYNGRTLTELHGHLLFFIQSNNKPLQLIALPETQMFAQEKSPVFFTTKLPKQVLPAISTDLYLNSQQQLRVFEQQKATSAQLSLSNTMAANSEKETPENAMEADARSNEGNNGVYITLVALFVFLGVYWFKFRNKSSNKHLHLYQHFARFTLSKDQQTLSFYDRHRESAKCSLLVKDIVSSELRLNDVSLNNINTDTQSGFNISIEVNIRNAFALEHRHKMVDDKVRHFDIILTDIHNKTYGVCLYYRKGNQRLTKVKYEKALDQCIDWCWFIAKQINPEHCAVRKAKSSPPRQTITKQPKAKVEVKKIKPVEAVKTTKPEEAATSEESQLTHDLGTDTAIVDALDKLVALKQKGFINEREFELAKAKLLQDLVEN